MKQLNKWLQLEAADKKNIPNAAGAVAKMVPVSLSDVLCSIEVLTQGIGARPA